MGMVVLACAGGSSPLGGRDGTQLVAQRAEVRELTRIERQRGCKGLTLDAWEDCPELHVV